MERSYTKKSEIVAKWGKCHGVLNSTSFKVDEGTRICKENGLDEKKQLEKKESSEVVCRREENGDYGDYLLTRVCGLDETCESKSHVCKREGDVCDNICSRPSHICRAGSDGVCITGDDFDNLERFENIKRCGFAKLCRKLFKWFVLTIYHRSFIGNQRYTITAQSLSILSLRIIFLFIGSIACRKIGMR